MQNKNQSKRMGKAIILQRLIPNHHHDSLNIRDYRCQKSLQKEKDDLYKYLKTPKSKEMSCQFYLNASIQSKEQIQQLQKTSSTQKQQSSSNKIVQPIQLYNDNSILQLSQDYLSEESSFSFSADSTNLDQIFSRVNLGVKIKIKDYLNQLKVQDEKQNLISF